MGLASQDHITESILMAPTFFLHSDDESSKELLARSSWASASAVIESAVAPKILSRAWVGTPEVRGQSGEKVEDALLKVGECWKFREEMKDIKG